MLRYERSHPELLKAAIVGRVQPATCLLAGFTRPTGVLLLWLTRDKHGAGRCRQAFDGAAVVGRVEKLG